ATPLTTLQWQIARSTYPEEGQIQCPRVSPGALRYQFGMHWFGPCSAEKPCPRQTCCHENISLASLSRALYSLRFALLIPSRDDIARLMCASPPMGLITYFNARRAS